jgi:hypothetical protein
MAMNLDDNLVSGQTYTFQFSCANTFCLTDLSSTIQSDIVQNAPSFISNLGVSSPPTTSLYNVQFTYSGDGSDVVSDVATEIIQAVQQGSGDSITFGGATGQAASSILSTNVSSAAATATSAATAAGNAASGLLSGATSAIAKGASNLLSPIEGVLILVVALAVVLILASGKAGGVTAGAKGLSIG